LFWEVYDTSAIAILAVVRYNVVMGATKLDSKDIKYDIIYVDIDDDITSVVEKIKSSKDEFVKLVPPKRPGFMQSAVTMKLLKRTAGKAKKHVAIVTTDKALLTLAATIGVFVAKNLQSEPVMLEKPAEAAEVKNDDVIEGGEVDINDYKDTSDIPEDKDMEVALRKKRGADDEDEDEDDERPGPPKKAPNFNKFRKWLLIGGLSVLTVAGVLVWAIIFAPKATITIHANTTSEKVQQTVQIGEKLNTDPATATIRSTVKSGEKDATVDGTATGERNDGTKATGAVDLDSSNVATCMNLAVSGIASGTSVTLSGKEFVTTAAATFVAGGSGCIANDVPIAAVAPGDGYNVANGGGVVSGYGSVMANGSAAGGTTKIVKFVTDQDVKIAQEKFKAENEEDFKNDLTRELAGDYIIISQSFKSSTGAPAASPGVNEAASDGKFRLTAKTTYSMEAVAKSEIEAYVRKILDTKAKDMNQQKVYNYGVDEATLTNYMRMNDKDPATITLFTTGKIGPDIDMEKVKTEMAGKKAMEVNEALKRINGVVEVETKFSYFWVNEVPNDAKKVEVKFESSN
jgi:hypothetical protein